MSHYGLDELVLYDIASLHLSVPDILRWWDKIAQLLLEIDEAGDVFMAFPASVLAGAFLQYNDAGVYIGVLKPALGLGFDDGDDFVIVKEEFLHALAVVNVEPGVRDD